MCYIKTQNLQNQIKHDIFAHNNWPLTDADYTSITVLEAIGNGYIFNWVVSLTQTTIISKLWSSLRILTVDTKSDSKSNTDKHTELYSNTR